VAAGQAWVRIRETGEALRELRERVEVPGAGAGTREVAMSVPVAWLQLGLYQVGLEESEAKPYELRVLP